MKNCCLSRDLCASSALVVDGRGPWVARFLDKGLFMQPSAKDADAMAFALQVMTEAQRKTYVEKVLADVVDQRLRSGFVQPH